MHLYEFFYAVYRLSEAHQFFEILEENHFWRCSIFAILKTLIDLIQTLFKTSILSSYLVLKPSPLVRIKLSIAPNENVRCGLKKIKASFLKPTGVQLEHPIVYDTYNVCSMVILNKLSKQLSVSVLRTMCEYFDLPVNQIKVHRKEPYVTLIKELVQFCSCHKKFWLSGQWRKPM